MNIHRLVCLAVSLFITPCIPINQDYNDFTDSVIDFQDLGQVLRRKIQELSDSNNDYLQHKPDLIGYLTSNSRIDGLKVRNGTSTNILSSNIYSNSVKNKEVDDVQDNKTSNAANEISDQEMRIMEKRDTIGKPMQPKVDEESSLAISNKTFAKELFKNSDNTTRNNATVLISNTDLIVESNDNLRSFRGIDDRDGRLTKSNVNRNNQVYVKNRNIVEGNSNSLAEKGGGSEAEQNVPQPLPLLSKDGCETCDHECECNFKKIVQMGRVLDTIFEKMGSNLRKDLGVCKKGKLFDQCPMAGDEETMEKIINEMVGCIKQTLKGQLSPKCCAPLPRELYSFLIWLLHGSEGGQNCPPTVSECKTRYTYLFHENHHKPHACGSVSHSDIHPKRKNNSPPFPGGDNERLVAINSNEMIPNVRVQNEYGQVQYIPNPKYRELQNLQEKALYQKKLPQGSAFLDLPNFLLPDIPYRVADRPINLYKDQMESFEWPDVIDMDYSDSRRQLRDVEDSFNENYDEEDTSENNSLENRVNSVYKLQDHDARNGLQDNIENSINRNYFTNSSSLFLKDNSNNPILELNRTKREKQYENTIKNMTGNHTIDMRKEIKEINQDAVKTVDCLVETSAGLRNESKHNSIQLTSNMNNESVAIKTNTIDIAKTSQLFENGKTTNGLKESRVDKDLIGKLIKPDESEINADKEELKQTDAYKKSNRTLATEPDKTTNKEQSSLNIDDGKSDENVKYNKARWKDATDYTVKYKIESSTSVLKNIVSSKVSNILNNTKGDSTKEIPTKTSREQCITEGSALLSALNDNEFKDLKLNEGDKEVNKTNIEAISNKSSNKNQTLLGQFSLDKSNKEKRSEKSNNLKSLIDRIRATKFKNTEKRISNFDSYKESNVPNNEDEDDLDFKSDEQRGKDWLDDQNDFESQYNFNVL